MNSRSVIYRFGDGQIPSFATTPKEPPQRRAFSRLHAVSAVANLAVLADGVVLVAPF